MTLANPTQHTDLLFANLIRISALTSLLVILLVCYFYPEALQIKTITIDLVFYRSILYGIAILLLPLMQFIRHIMLRLNRQKTAKQRYFMTIAVMMTLAESIGLFGLLMFSLGDEINSLYIFSALSMLAMFLHRPKQDEYQQLLEQN